MSTASPQKRLTVFGLLLVATVVWGTVGYRVWMGTQSADPVASPARVPLAATSDRLGARYEDDFADPFAPAISAQPQTGPSREESGVADPRPPAMSDLDALRQFQAEERLQEMGTAEPREPENPWRLRGVVGDAAILETDGGMTRLARVGDYVGDHRVVSIGPRGVRLESDRGEYEVTL